MFYFYELFMIRIKKIMDYFVTENSGITVFVNYIAYSHTCCIPCVCSGVCPKCMCMCVSQVYMEGEGNHHRTCAHVSVSVGVGERVSISQ